MYTTLFIFNPPALGTEKLCAVPLNGWLDDVTLTWVGVVPDDFSIV
jgi:hypothetical protein